MKHLLLVLLLAATAQPALAGCEGLAVKNGWVREAPPGAMMLAAYATLTNAGAKARKVTSADSPDFGLVEFHETTQVEGRMHMRQLQAVIVPAGSETTLRPGGAHLMLMQPQRSLRSGDRVSFNLHCGDGAPLSITLPVQQAPTP